MVICESFFAEYKRFDEVKCEELGPSIDEGFEEDLPIESAALTIVHGMFSILTIRGVRTLVTRSAMLTGHQNLCTGSKSHSSSQG